MAVSSSSGSRTFSLLLAHLCFYLSLLKLIHATGEFRVALDDMSRFFDQTLYPHKQYNQLLECMHHYDTDSGAKLLKAQDVAWSEFYSYWLSDGMVNDTWGSRESPYYESQVPGKKALFGKGARIYEIQQKCNYVSNVAYYRAAIRICDYPDWRTLPKDYQEALMKSLVTLGTGSGWLHGSITELGRQFDGYMVAIAVNNAYRILVRSVNKELSPVLLTVSDSLEPVPMPKLADQAAYMTLRTNGTSEWEDYLRSLQVVRGYTRTALAIMAFSCAISAPFWFCDCLVNEILVPALGGKGDAAFFRDSYMPELQPLAKEQNYPLPLWIGLPLLKRALGVVIGLVWAFLFQEEQIETPCLTGDFFNFTRLGAFKNPMVDYIVTQISGIANTETLSPVAQGVYPGGTFCNRDSPHAMWHERSADSLVELYNLMDQVDETLVKYQQKHQGRRRSLQQQQHWLRHGTSSSEGNITSESAWF